LTEEQLEELKRRGISIEDYLNAQAEGGESDFEEDGEEDFGEDGESDF